MIHPIPTYIFNWYIFQNGTFSHPCARRAHRNPLAEYIQYKCTPPKRTTPHNCWQNISNTNIYLKTCKCPNLVPEGHTDSPQLNNTLQLLAEYIQYKCTSTIVGRTYPIQIYVSEHVHALTLCLNGTQTPPNLTTLNNCWQNISHTIYTCWHPCTELLSKRQHVPRNMKNSPLDGVVQSYKSYTVRGETLYFQNLQNKYQARKPYIKAHVRGWS